MLAQKVVFEREVRTGTRLRQPRAQGDVHAAEKIRDPFCLMYGVFSIDDDRFAFRHNERKRVLYMADPIGATPLPGRAGISR